MVKSDQLSFFEKIKGHSMVRFGLVGVVSTSTDILVLYLMDRMGVNAQLATTAGFMSGLTVGFLLNGRYVFAQSHTVARYLKYGLISFGGYLITLGIVYVLHDESGWPVLFAKLPAVAIVFFWNYFWSKLWAFK